MSRFVAQPDRRICNCVWAFMYDVAFRLRPLLSRIGLLLQLSVAVHEAVYATCCINKLALACVEWVRSVRDFYLHYRISLSLKLDSVVCLAGRACEEHIAVRHILEYYRTIVLWVDTFFQLLISFVKFIRLLHKAGAKLLLFLEITKFSKMFYLFFNENCVYLHS